MAEKNPWFRLYAKDVLADESLRLCSLESRGLWIYLLSLMHRCVPRGYLVQENGKPITTDQLARLASCSRDEADRCINELLTAGVFAVSDDGRVYSRRMVKETRISEERSKAGKIGAQTTNGMTGENFAAAKQSAKPRQTGRQNSGKTMGMGITKQPSYSSEEEKEEEELFDPPGKGVQGEGVLPRQNDRQNSGKTESDDLSPEWLARIWCSQCAAKRGRVVRDKPEDISPQFAAWIAFGVPPEEIALELRKPSSERDYSEHAWQLKQRLFDRLGLSPGRNAGRKTKEQIHAENEAAFKADLAERLKGNPAFSDHPDHEKWKAEQRRMGRTV